MSTILSELDELWYKSEILQLKIKTNGKVNKLTYFKANYKSQLGII